MYRQILLKGILLLLILQRAQLQSIDDEDAGVTFVKNFADYEDDDYDMSSEDIDFNARADFIDDEEDIVDTLSDENEAESHYDWYQCDKDLRQPHGLRKFIDLPFLKKLVRNLNPFAAPRMQMFFYLFKREFPNCGRELDFEVVEDVINSGFDPALPTRIIIHGWMSQSRGSFNRDVKDAYLSRGNFNVIIADWSASASNLNYFSVVKMIEGFGAQVARFTQQLQRHLGASYDDMYLIGHSLGAQIAGAAGKRIRPAQYNTIFALDPAGPKFRHRSADFRIDPSDAKYVESIQTSANLGFLKPTGMATFYPNYGVYQKNCYFVGCSHIRAYKMFAESISSPLGFWGTPCKRNGKQWKCDESRREMFQMGGEPSVPKKGLFYVKTGTSSPFALGRS